MNILKFGKAVFVLDEDESTEYMKTYVTEMNTETFVIREDLTQTGRPYYDFLREYQEEQIINYAKKKRTFREGLFSSSKIDKIRNYVENYFK